MLTCPVFNQFFYTLLYPEHKHLYVYNIYTIRIHPSWNEHSYPIHWQWDTVYISYISLCNIIKTFDSYAEYLYKLMLSLTSRHGLHLRLASAQRKRMTALLQRWHRVNREQLICIV